MYSSTWWLLIVIYTMITTNLASLAVSIYLHRQLTHGSIELNPLSFSFFRFIIWFITGMEPAEWKVVHLSHHQAPADSPDDVHSPRNEGMGKIVAMGVYYYVKATERLKHEIEIERLRTSDFLDTPLFKRTGVALNLFLNIMLWGFYPGLIVWIVQIAWIPFWAAGVINGLGHGAHEKDSKTHDHSKDILEDWPTPFQVLLNVITGGESRHHAHHLKASSARFTTKDEFDWGYTVICVLAKLRLAKILRA